MEKIFCAYSMKTDRTYRCDTMIGHAPLQVTEIQGSGLEI